jgi:hypothetical protein
MPYERPLGCRHKFRIKTEIAKTKPNQFFHIFLSGLFSGQVCLSGIPAGLLCKATKNRSGSLGTSPEGTVEISPARSAGCTLPSKTSPARDGWNYSKTGNGLTPPAPEREGALAHTGMANSGIGSEMKNLRVYRESQRAPEFAFFLLALSVLMPVPAYILR